MKLSNLLYVIILSAGLSSCGCEDVYLGELEHTKELTTYLPVKQVDGKSFIITYENTSLPMYYRNIGTYSTMKVAVAGTGKKKLTGKFIPTDCIEYYTAEKQEYSAIIEGENPFSIIVKYTKDVNEDVFNNITDKEQVADIIKFTLGFNNMFPTTITRDRYEYNNFISYRSFTFSGLFF